MYHIYLWLIEIPVLRHQRGFKYSDIMSIISLDYNIGILINFYMQ
jgi:hypothetical protein